MLFRKKAEDVLKLINALSEEERATVLARLGGEAEPAPASPEAENREEVAEQNDNEAPESTAESEEPREEREADAAGEVPSPEGEAGSAEPNADAPEPPEEEDADQGQSESAGRGEDAMRYDALTARIDELTKLLDTRVKPLEDFVAALREEDGKQKAAIGFPMMERARSEAQESYHDLRRRVVGK
ncbi:MAG: hypothetical protein E7663_04760 [Ruminococcaceae bacterium]|nr:hypothetical protein [Oscillospiraceae bacterium]